MLLYQFHELWRAGMAPYTYWAEAGAKMFSAPGSWLAGMPEAPRVAAGCELDEGLHADLGIRMLRRIAEGARGHR